MRTFKILVHALLSLLGFFFLLYTYRVSLECVANVLYSESLFKKRIRVF